MRNEFGKTLTEIIRQDKKVYLIAMDTGYAIFDKIKEKNLKNYLNVGLTEQATIGFASSMALDGFKPFVYAILPFILDRVYEQIKLDIVGQKANVKLISYFDYSTSGITHNSPRHKELCDILGINYIAPKTKEETRKTILDIYKINEPFFIYLTKAK